MSTTPDPERLRQASEWVQRLAEHTATEQLMSDWYQWCNSHPENLRLFEQMQEVWDGLGPSRVARVLPVASRRRHFVPLALAATVLVAVGAALWTFPYDSTRTELHTAIGELHQQLLPDGSRLDLGADSKVLVQFTEQERTLHLVKGRAFFSVVRDPVRPFIVRAGGLRVTAVGTQFDVRMGPDKTIVTVGEGRVSIVAEDGEKAAALQAPVQADAGQRVSYSGAAKTLAVKRVDPRITESWRHGVLQFQEEPLRDVVNEVNRYVPRPIVLGSSELGLTPFTGTISPKRVDDWLSALSRLLPITVDDRGEEGIHISYTNPPARSN